jgi:hypothetical protein
LKTTPKLTIAFALTWLVAISALPVLTPAETIYYPPPVIHSLSIPPLFYFDQDVTFSADVQTFNSISNHYNWNITCLAGTDLPWFWVWFSSGLFVEATTITANFPLPWFVETPLNIAEFRISFEVISQGGSAVVYQDITVVQVPILLVYGWHGEESNWNVIKSGIESYGRAVKVLEYDTSKSAEYSAEVKLAPKVAEMRDPDHDGTFEVEKVDIIAHSFGGLVSRYYIEHEGGAQYVRNLIMIATPNHGSKLADYLTGKLDFLPDSSHIKAAMFPIALAKELTNYDISWASTQELCTEQYNTFLKDLNNNYGSGSGIETNYFTIAGTGHFDFPGSVFSTYLTGHDDGIVKVDSVRLPGIPLYCVAQDHCTLFDPSSIAVQEIIMSILQGSPAPPPFFPEPKGPDSADSWSFLIVGGKSGRIGTGGSLGEDFRVSGWEFTIQVTSRFCTFNFTLTSPSGRVITSEVAAIDDDVDFIMGEHYWYYTLRNSEKGIWSFNVTALETPEGGTDLVISILGNPDAVSSYIADMENLVFQAEDNHAYFVYADPYRMTRAVATYDVAAGNIVYGKCTNTQNQAFDSNPQIVSQNEDDKGRLLLNNQTVLMFGSRNPCWGVRYLEDKRLTPVYFQNDGTNIKLIENATDTAKVDRVLSSIDFEHEDYFVLMACVDQNGNHVFINYGFEWKGTWAAGMYLKAIYPNIQTYTNSYYIIHWQDTNNDGIPQTNEMIPIPT